MSHIEQIGDATLYLGDCLETLPTLGKVDAPAADREGVEMEGTMTLVQKTSGLTNPYGKKGEQFVQTHEGMASWAAEVDKACRECKFCISQGYYSKNGKGAGGLKPVKCAKYSELMGHSGSSFPWNTRGCKHFETNPSPPRING